MSQDGPISLGQVVTSIAGRDIGKEYLVVRIYNKGLLVSDGRSRPIENPKKKNVRHVKVNKRICESIRSKLISEFKVTNEELRQGLKVYPDNL